MLESWDVESCVGFTSHSSSEAAIVMKRVQLSLKRDSINLDAQHKNHVEMILPGGQSRVFWPQAFY